MDVVLRHAWDNYKITIKHAGIGTPSLCSKDRDYTVFGDAMSLEEVVLDNGGTTTRLVNDNATENLQGGMVSNVGLLPTAEELCPSCLSSHWGVIAGEMKRTDLGDIKDVFYLIPYVAGTTAATDFIGNITKDKLSWTPSTEVGGIF